MEKVLVKIAEMIGDRKWILVGGASRVLQGVQESTKDIDILTDEKTAYEIDKIFSDYAKKKMAFSEQGPFVSHFGVYEVDGMVVEVMGDLKLKNNDIVYSMEIGRMEEYGRTVEVGGKKILVEPLEEAVVAGLVLGRISQSEKIARFLETHGFDDRYVARVLEEENLPGYISEEVWKMLES